MYLFDPPPVLYIINYMRYHTIILNIFWQSASLYVSRYKSCANSCDKTQGRPGDFDCNFYVNALQTQFKQLPKVNSSIGAFNVVIKIFRLLSLHFCVSGAMDYCRAFVAHQWLTSSTSSVNIFVGPCYQYLKKKFNRIFAATNVKKITTARLFFTFRGKNWEYNLYFMIFRNSDCLTFLSQAQKTS